MGAPPATPDAAAVRASFPVPFQDFVHCGVHLARNGRRIRIPGCTELFRVAVAHRAQVCLFSFVARLPVRGGFGVVGHAWRRGSWVVGRGSI
jgi:hypothetical protein